MSERASEVPFSLARGGHRGRECRARVRDDPGFRGSDTGQEDCRGEEATRPRPSPKGGGGNARWVEWAISATLRP